MTIARLLVAQRPTMTPTGWVAAPLRVARAEPGRVALSVSLAFALAQDQTWVLAGAVIPETPIPGGEAYAAQLSRSIPLERALGSVRSDRRHLPV